MVAAQLFMILSFAHIIETVLGFGGTIISLALGSYIVSLPTLISALVLVGLVQSSYLMIREWRFIDWRGLTTRILPFALLGLAVGILVRNNLTIRNLRVMLGLVIVLLSVIQLARLYIVNHLDTDPESNPTGARIMLALGGIFHGLYAAGGPFVIYYAQRRYHDPRRIRATLGVLWTVLSIPMLLNMLHRHEINASVLHTIELLLPGVIAGIIIGSLIRLSGRLYKLVAYIVLALCGASISGA